MLYKTTHKQKKNVKLFESVSVHIHYTVYTVGIPTKMYDNRKCI